MSRKPKTTNAEATRKVVKAQPILSAELLHQLIPSPVSPAQLEDLFQQLKKSVIEHALGAEMSHHLSYAPGEAKHAGTYRNHRNGKSSKRVITDTGEPHIDVPRDREGSFEPQLIGKHERRFTGFDDKIVAMYSPLNNYRRPPPHSFCGHFPLLRTSDLISNNACFLGVLP